ncbi:MAG: hypothetical protein E4H01_01275 [Lysobacterales bacterium]|nr:MAG: hypothetical protein E4H01_01275 [Xanthomonadales bacterium]
MPKPKQAFSGTRGEKKPGRPVATAFTWVLLALLASPSGLWLRSAAAQTPSAYGVAVTPRNFPDFGIEDVDAAFAVAKRIGDYAVFIYQWDAMDIRLAHRRQRQRAGATPIYPDTA